MYVASEHIQNWIETGKATLVPVGIAMSLGAYLNRLPWLASGSGLDWSRIRCSQVSVSTLTSSQLRGWLHSTLLVNDPAIVFWYASDQPCIACDASFAMAHIDQAFWKAPGKRYLFGASPRNGQVEPFASHFAEFDGADTVVAAQ